MSRRYFRNTPTGYLPHHTECMERLTSETWFEYTWRLLAQLEQKRAPKIPPPAKLCKPVHTVEIEAKTA